jgi:hypothetical protein
MEISRGFMPLLMELGGWEIDSCYKHVTPNGLPRFSAVFDSATPDLDVAKLSPPTEHAN